MLRWRKLRLEASCSLFIRPSVRTLPHTHTAHLLPKTHRPALLRKRQHSRPPRPGTEEPGKLGPLRDASFVSPQLQRMDGSRGGAIYPPVEICGRWGGGTLSLFLRGLR